jgi:hypothetical protein
MEAQIKAPSWRELKTKEAGGGLLTKATGGGLLVKKYGGVQDGGSPKAPSWRGLPTKEAGGGLPGSGEHNSRKVQDLENGSVDRIQ